VGGRGGLQESQTLKHALVVTLVVAMFGTNLDAMVDLNQIEANTWGEFGIGSIIQFGSIDFTFVYNDVWL